MFFTSFVETATKPPPTFVAWSFIIPLFSTSNFTRPVEFIFEFSIFVFVEVSNVNFRLSTATFINPPEPFDVVTSKVLVDLLDIDQLLIPFLSSDVISFILRTEVPVKLFIASGLLTLINPPEPEDLLNVEFLIVSKVILALPASKFPPILPVVFDFISESILNLAPETNNPNENPLKSEIVFEL